MINYNGNLLAENTPFLDHRNRGLRYGDGLFEAMRALNGKLIFWEDHYLRLMASMRILRMEIPMNFTMEFLEERIMETVEANGLDRAPARVRLTVYRNDGGRYLPESNDISYIIEADPLAEPFYVLDGTPYEVDLYKDFYVNKDMLSNLKTNNKVLNVVGSIFAEENGLQNCLLLNGDKQVVEALNGNIFVVKDGHIKTPPLEHGCLDGILRKKLIAILKKLEEYSFEEGAVSPFELQKADELFITNSVVGIRPVSKYRKKQYHTTVAQDLVGKLNANARLA
ncbi:aminotransferase class IV [Pseudozobellia thermophila]|uniref:branched-chain-amino-acid transaminase n=1 Tax=Pseudozobellia thermophila TaxID=192903 RepID=A0A1M6LIA7_9FLAO|nr:aminotransferase class IV [Pseudozobellia thermophila]SHJ70917.1 branched-chain amino acid aminotransferase [Pseudozobellia thermophila]